MVDEPFMFLMSLQQLSPVDFGLVLVRSRDEI